VHDHHHHQHASGKNLRLAFFLNLGFTIFEIIGGIYVNSVAILSDAIHDLGDSLSLGTAWYLDSKSRKGADKDFSFGYARFSLLGALINCLVLIGGSIIIIREAVGRLMEPEASDAQGMMFFAIIGIAVNGYAAWKMSGGQTLNEKVVSWHLVEDVLGWVAVLVVSIILQFKEILYLDPALSLLITVYILWGAVKRLKDTLFVFLQGIPKEVDLEEIKQRLEKVENVASLHHTHLWSLEGQRHVFTTHVKLTKLANFDDIKATKEKMKAILSDYQLEHFTIETELPGEPCGMGEEGS
jgi:cobalt-zinc-cadmium efflux system protein